MQARSVRNDEITIQGLSKKKPPPPPTKTLDIVAHKINKRTTQVDAEQSQMSVHMVQMHDGNDDGPASCADRNKWKRKLSKKDSIFYRPSEIENKVLETIVLKVR